MDMNIKQRNITAVGKKEINLKKYDIREGREVDTISETALPKLSKKEEIKPERYENNP